MKVAFHVDQLWFDAPGGIGTYVWELLQALPAADPSLELVPFHARWRRPPPRAPLAAGGSWGVELPWSIRALYPAWARLRAPHLVRSLDECAVVHATNHAAVPPVRSHQRLIVTVHDLAFEGFPELFPRRWRWLYRAGLRAAIERAHGIVVPSRSTADEVMARGANPSTVHVTPLAPSLAPTDADPKATLERLGLRQPFVLTVGTLEPRKNLIRLVRAYRRVAPKLPHTLVLAGPTGWQAAELEAELGRPGPGTIVRTGRVDGAELAALYRSADAFAYVSLYEGFGLPVIEAMEAGTPVVASSTSSIPEVAGDAALLVDPEDVDAIADALRRVLSEPALAHDLRRRGRERAAGFTWERTARATLDVYRHVTGAS